MAQMDDLDPRRRRGPGGGGYEGIGGAQVLPGQFLPFLQGNRTWDFGGGIQGQGGLAALLAQLAGNPNMGRGPALSHLLNQGVDFPDVPSGGGPGGPNLAPGNLQNQQALSQPTNPAGKPMQSQGWRNYAPGYGAAAALGYGSRDPQANLFGAGAPPAGEDVGRPGASFLGAAQRGPGGTTGQEPPASRLAPKAIRGGGNTISETPGLGKPKPGGGTAPKGVTPQVKKQSAQQSTARGGQELPKGGGAVGIQDNAGGIKGAKPKVNKPFDVVKAGGNPFVDTINIVPNAGNNNTPSETKNYSVGKKKSASSGKKVGSGKPSGLIKGQR